MEPGVTATCVAAAIALSLLAGACIAGTWASLREARDATKKLHDEQIKLAVALARYEEQATKAMMIFQRANPWQR